MPWRPICIANSSKDTPQLLLNHEFMPEGYTILLTDLSRLWTETLEKRQIKLRALTDNTSIDPSEDNSQFNIFLSKIKDALNGIDGTSVQIITKSEDKLVLETYTTLPPPLESLRWRAELTLLSQEHVRPNVTLPLVRHLYKLGKRQDDLIRQLHDKDAVITKLLDKLESIGQGIQDLFPSAARAKSPKRATSREQAGQHVKGLRQFDEDQRVQHSADDAESILPNDMVEEVFRQGIAGGGGDAAEDTRDRWWEYSQEKYLASESHGAQVPHRSKESASKKRRSQDMNGENEIEDDSGFQVSSIPETIDFFTDNSRKRQTTTPALRQRAQDASDNATRSISSKKAEPQKGYHSETETDDDDLDGPAIRQSQSQSSQTAQKSSVYAEASKSKSPLPPPTKKLGRIGGAREQTPVQDLIPPEPSPQKDNEEHADKKTKVPQTQAKIQSRSKLGIIGGRKATKNRTPEPSAAPATPKKVIDKIGGKMTTPSKSSEPQQGGNPAAREMTPSKTPDKPKGKVAQTAKAPEPDIPPETEEEKANRRREELKRQLEAKAQAPAKKKRRF